MALYINADIRTGQFEWHLLCENELPDGFYYVGTVPRSTSDDRRPPAHEMLPLVNAIMAGNAQIIYCQGFDFSMGRWETPIRDFLEWLMVDFCSDEIQGLRNIKIDFTNTIPGVPIPTMSVREAIIVSGIVDAAPAISCAKIAVRCSIDDYTETSRLSEKIKDIILVVKPTSLATQFKSLSYDDRSAIPTDLLPENLRTLTLMGEKLRREFARFRQQRKDPFAVTKLTVHTPSLSILRHNIITASTKLWVNVVKDIPRLKLIELTNGRYVVKTFDFNPSRPHVDPTPQEDSDLEPIPIPLGTGNEIDYGTEAGTSSGSIRPSLDIQPETEALTRSM